MPNILTTDFLSQFDDPPEDPLREGGNWFPPFLGSIPGSYILDMRKEGGDATDQYHPRVLSGYIAYSYWTPMTFSGDHVEVWGIATGGQLGAALETWRLFMWQQLYPPAGYLVYYGGGIGKGLVIRRYNGNWTYDVIASAGSFYPGYLLLRINGADIEAWAADTDPQNLALQCSAPDPNYRGPFHIGMGIEDPTVGGLAWTAFGGGVKRRTQFYRWVKGL